MSCVDRKQTPPTNQRKLTWVIVEFSSLQSFYNCNMQSTYSADAVNKLNKIVKVSMDKKITVLESGGIVDFPASVKIDNSSGPVGQQQQQQGQVQRHNK